MIIFILIVINDLGKRIKPTQRYRGPMQNLRFSTTFFVKIILGMFITVLLFGQANAASEPRLLGEYGKWNAFSFTDDQGKKVCFMSSTPSEAKGNYTKRGEIFAFITHWPSKGYRNMINIDTGYPYKVNSEVDVKIGSQDFTLATEGEKAWAYNQATDNKITEAIRQGSTMVVKGYSTRGTLTTDTYSLSGSADAYDAITRECY